MAAVTGRRGPVWGAEGTQEEAERRREPETAAAEGSSGTRGGCAMEEEVRRVAASRAEGAAG